MSHSVLKGKRFGKPRKAREGRQEGHVSHEGLILYLKENVLGSQVMQGKEGKGPRKS